jgi:hypothetical protein
VRFNEPVRKAFDGAKYCLVRVTNDGKYIVFIPQHGGLEEKTATNSRICDDKSHGIRVSLNKYVSSGTIKRSLFGKRYKVKKDKRGYIYVCLEEPVEGVGEYD